MPFRAPPVPDQRDKRRYCRSHDEISGGDALGQSDRDIDENPARPNGGKETLRMLI